MLLTEVGYISADVQKVLIHMDNLSAKHLAKNPEFHQRTKHIDKVPLEMIKG